MAATTATTTTTPPCAPFTFTFQANAQQATKPSSICNDVATKAHRFIEKSALLHTQALKGAMGDTTAVDYRYTIKLSDGQPWPLHFVAFKCKYPATKTTLTITRVELCKAWEIARNDTFDFSRIIMILTGSKLTKDPVFKACLDKATILIGCYYELSIALNTIHEWEATSHVPTSWAPMPAPLPSLAVLHSWPHRLTPDSPTAKSITPVFLHAARFLLSTDPNDLAAFRFQLLQHMEGTPLGLEGYSLPAGFYLSESELKQEDHVDDLVAVQGGGKRRRRSIKMAEKPRRRGDSAARAIWALDPVFPHQREEVPLLKQKRRATVPPPQPPIPTLQPTILSPQLIVPSPQPTFPPQYPIIPFARLPAPASTYPAAVWMRSDFTEYRERQEEDSSDEDEATVDDDESDWDDDEDKVKDDVVSDTAPGGQLPPSPPQIPASSSTETAHNIQDGTGLHSAGPTDPATSSTPARAQEDACIRDFIFAIFVLMLLFNLW